MVCHLASTKPFSEPVGTKFSEILIEILYFFFQENAFENVIWKMEAIFCQPKCLNHTVSKLESKH